MEKILVNKDKVLRAEEIVNLLGRAPRNDRETEVKNHFGKLVVDAKVKAEDMVVFVYEKLGGLVRTPADEVAHAKKVVEMKEKAKKLK